MSTDRSRAAAPYDATTPTDALRAALAQLTEGVVVADAAGRITFVNEAAARLHGVARLGVPVEEYSDTYHLLTEDGRPYPPAELPLARAVLHGETLIDARWRIRRPDGTEVLAVGSARPVRDADGRQVGAVLTMRDDTPRVAAERALAEREAHFRTIADAIPTLAWTARADGHIDWYNGRWYEYTGTAPAQMEGWGWQSVHDPAVLPAVLERWRASIATGRPFEMTFPLLGADGRFRAFLTRVTPLRDADGRIARWFGTNTDVDALHATERALRRANAELETRTAELQAAGALLEVRGREAERARTQAESANAAKGDFLAAMSHELRTPLNAIQGYADLLALGIRGGVTAEQLEDLSRIKRSGRHLLTIINDILQYAKLEAGHLAFDLAPVPLDAALAELGSLLAPQFGAKRLTYTYEPCDPALRAYADRDKLQQIVLNLLTNAGKFTPPGGRVTLACAATDAEVRVHVADTGVGVAPDRLEHVFDPFVQVERRLSSPRDGVGLGLAISRDLARGMGGTLTVASRVGEGSTFTLALPRVA